MDKIQSIFKKKSKSKKEFREIDDEHQDQERFKTARDIEEEEKINEMIKGIRASVQINSESDFESGEDATLASEPKQSEKTKNKKSDKIKSVFQIAQDHGYALKAYKYTTSDGYINTVLRMSKLIDNQQQQQSDLQRLVDQDGQVYNLSQEFVFTKVNKQFKKAFIQQEEQKQQQKRVAILQHGITDSAAGWMMNGAKSISFRLVDHGFDVWINNSRGHLFSLDHESIDVRSKNSNLPQKQKEKRMKYWDFSFHEHGIYDQPALWNFVLKETGAKRIQYVCHSQGFTQILVAMMAFPEFFRKHMSLCVGIAPVYKLDHATIDTIKKLGSRKSIIKLAKSLCPDILQKPISQMTFMGKLQLFSQVTNKTEALPFKYLVEENPEYVSEEALKNIMGHLPAGGSWRQLDHYRQLLYTQEFKMYDFDYDAKAENKTKNMQVYGQDTPPLYPLHLVSNFPVLMVCGKSDKLCKPGDYLQLYQILKGQNSCVGKIETSFGHLSLLNPKFSEFVASRNEQTLFEDHIELFIQYMLDPPEVKIRRNPKTNQIIIKDE